MIRHMTPESPDADSPCGLDPALLTGTSTEGRASVSAPATSGLSTESPSLILPGLLALCSTLYLGPRSLPPLHCLSSESCPHLSVQPCSSAPVHAWLLTKMQVVNIASDLLRQTPTFLMAPLIYSGSVRTGSQTLGSVPAHLGKAPSSPSSRQSEAPLSTMKSASEKCTS